MRQWLSCSRRGAVVGWKTQGPEQRKAGCFEKRRWPLTKDQQRREDLSPTTTQNWILPTIWWAWTWIRPQTAEEGQDQLTPWVWPSETLSRAPSWICPTSILEKGEIINRCYFKPLHLFWFVRVAMEIHVSWLENANSSNTTLRCIRAVLQKILN